MRRHRALRPIAFAVALLLASASIVLADDLAADADAVTPGPQATIDLGIVDPGTAFTQIVGFRMTCGGLAHVDAGASVFLSPTSIDVPANGAATASPAVIGPLQAWPADGVPCFDPPQAVSARIPSGVMLTAPTVAGTHTFRVTYAAATSNTDTAAVSGDPIVVTIVLTVGGNTPPSLHLPASFSVEGNTTGGATVTYAASATDAEDDPDPDPTCSPASGAFFALGTTTVNCSVTDSGRLTVTGSFDVTVVDTTAPTLSGLPGGIVVGTADPDGTKVTWTGPTAADAVDSNPTVACSRASGSAFPVGQTTVTCTATDASGNHAQGPFTVDVVLFGAVFDSPIGPSNVIGINGSRTLPVKVRLTRDGAPILEGAVRLVVTDCAGGLPLRAIRLDSQGGGRWTGHLDTDGLVGVCLRATVTVDGLATGSFEIRGASAERTPGSAKPKRR